jgi:putative spermidine/putrescine transport system ATP-binding protein
VPETSQVTGGSTFAASTSAIPADVHLDDVSKHYGSVAAVAQVTLEVAPREFFALLGPSGSGKTTCLRMIAGFERPDTGRVLLHGEDVTGLPPYRRDVNTVFQDYALFPHMTVLENVEYGLKVGGVEKAERRRRAGEALDMVHLSGYDARRPSQLSGGQRQRVALARALVNHPSVLLLDEPLGALDAKLRHEMQAELKRIQAEVGITFVFVTHDQDEALAMSDRIAIFNGGRIEQVGTPREVYEEPTTAFVAGFVGTSNTLSGEVAARLRGQPSDFTVRPERIRLFEPGRSDVPVRATGTVASVVYLGERTRFTVELDGGGALVVVRQNGEPDGSDRSILQGQRVDLSWSPDSERVLGLTEPKREEAL